MNKQTFVSLWGESTWNHSTPIEDFQLRPFSPLVLLANSFSTLENFYGHTVAPRVVADFGSEKLHQACVCDGGVFLVDDVCRCHWSNEQLQRRQYDALFYSWAPPNGKWQMESKLMSNLVGWQTPTVAPTRRPKFDWDSNLKTISGDSF